MEEQTENVVPENQALVSLLKENNIPEETAVSISGSFAKFYDQAQEWKKKASEYLEDENISEDEKLKEVKKARLALVKVRTGIEKVRKELNDGDQRKISDRNSAAKVVTSLGLESETLLQEYEDKKAKEQEAIDNALKNSRILQLDVYNVDSTFYDLKNMPEEAFQTLLDNSRILAEAKIENERKNQEKADKEERFTKRLVRLTGLGYSFDSTEFKHEKGLTIESIKVDDFLDDIFEDKFNELKNHIEEIKSEEAAKKKAEDDRLLSEKQEVERKNALLLQEKKEKEDKHNEAILRQKLFATVNYQIDYDTVLNMNEVVCHNLFREKESEYNAEEDRKFIAKKKKEREDKEAKDKADKEVQEKREADLAPDKIKLQIFVDRVHNLVMEFDSNKFNDRESELIYQNFFGMMKRANEWAKEKIKNLK